jgi:Glycosyl transferase family 2
VSLFTIGIPTYNRAGFLIHAIEAALDQTWPEVEVIVSDDASTDATPEIVRSYGDRVRYHRNPQNLGNWPNFARLTELARGEFFSWLQDDDVIHRDFVRRAIAGLNSADNVAVYTTFEANGPSATAFNRPLLYGPPIALDWMRSKLRVIDGNIIAPLSFFVSFANPPAVAFRINAIRNAIGSFEPDCELLNERIVLTRAAAGARVAVDPWLGAVFLSHEQQLSRAKSSYGAIVNQWILMSECLGRHLDAIGIEAWKHQLERCFEDIAIPDRLTWFREIAPFVTVPEDVWERAHPRARDVRSLLVASLPASLREQLAAEASARMERQKSPVVKENPPPKTTAWSCVPALAWDALRMMRRYK